MDPEPDPPIHTPRVAIAFRGAAGTSISVRRTNQGIDRQLATVDPMPGAGVALHTYGGTTDLVAIDALPRPFAMNCAVEALADLIWTGLDPNVRVALALGRAESPEPTRLIHE